MISAFDVYLVMQMDSFGSTFAGIGFLAAAMSVCSFFAWYFCASADPDEWYSEGFKKAAENRKKRAPSMFSVFRKSAVVSLAAFAIGSFIPSTKTAAAMIVLPAITSDRVINAVTPELRDLLDLTKGALRNMAGEKKDAHEPR